MITPNKFVTYKKSILSKFPIFLSLLSISDLSVGDLYNKTKSQIENAQEFMDILDCLCLLGKVELIEEVVHYVKTN